VHATFRRIKTQPGKAADVARLIEADYLPLIQGVAGFVSYTLVDLGDDEVSSVGLFTSAASAEKANETAKAWTAETLAPYVDSPLEARAGLVLVDHRA
jgi:hypothetical protein